MASNITQKAPRLKLTSLPTPLEKHEQESYFSWLNYIRYQGDRVQDFAYAIPNGAFLAGNPAKRAIQANYLTKQGMKAGVPDVCLAIAVLPFHGLYIEFKRIGASSPQPNQLEWHARLRKQGYCVHVCHGFEAAKAITLWYLKLPSQEGS